MIIGRLKRFIMNLLAALKPKPKKDDVEELISAHLAQIKKLKSEYQKLVSAVQKELEKIKIEKIKKGL